jgi:GNAT superfamily N-acetyltransferase
MALAAAAASRVPSQTRESLIVTADYHIRKATPADIDAIVRHRTSMFSDMGEKFDPDGLAAAFVPWAREAMAKGTYHHWLAETQDGRAAAGAGLSVLPWPPGPHYFEGRLAFVYNVYTERPDRRRGLARRLMDTLHAWCRAEDILVMALHATDEGRPLYESMGYRPTNEMRLWLGR